jgi:hypothetical protein
LKRHRRIGTGFLWWPGLGGGVGSGVGEAYEDISTVVLNILQAEFGTAPAAEEGESKIQNSCFS